MYSIETFSSLLPNEKYMKTSVFQVNIKCIWKVFNARNSFIVTDVPSTDININADT